jgi:CHAT domain-containing protein/tetratricopeptide (TPR) repeat protein
MTRRTLAALTLATLAALSTQVGARGLWSAPGTAREDGADVEAQVEALPPPAAQQGFAQRALEAVAQSDDLGRIVDQAPYRATSLVYDLLRQVARQGGDDWALATARSIARAVANEQRREALVELCERFDAERWRELHSNFSAVHEAIADARWVIALERASGAVELALTLDDLLLEADVRRLLAQVHLELGELDSARVELSRCVEVARELELTHVLAQDLAKFGYVEFRLGRYAPALSALELSRAASKASGERSNVSEAELGALYSNLGRYRDAQGALQNALREARASSDLAAEAYALEVLGTLAGARGHYTDALRLVQQAIEIAERSGSSAHEGSARTKYAGLLSELGRTSDAEDALAVALERLEVGSLPHTFASLTLGVVLLDGGRSEEALSILETVRRELTEAGHADGLAEARAQTASALVDLARYEQAEAALRALADELADQQDVFSLSLCLTQLGEVLETCGEMEEARGVYNQALEHASRLGVVESAWRARAGLGRVLEAGGREADALRAYERALAEVEAVRTRLGAPLLRQRFLGDKLELYRRAARLHGRAGRFDEAFRRSEGARARTLLELQGARSSSTVRADDTALQALNEAESELLMVELRFSAALREGCDEETRNELSMRRSGARARHTEARVAASLAAPHAAASGGLSEPATIDQVRARLPADVVLLEYVVGAEGVAMFVVSKDGVQLIELELSRHELNDLVDRIYAPLTQLQTGRTDAANLTFDVRAARALYQCLLEPVAAEIAPYRALWIVPDGPLWRLPFGLLVTDYERRPVDPFVLYSQYTGCQFLIQEHTLVLLPSAGVIVADDAKTRPRRPDRTLALGAPEPLPQDAPHLAGAAAELRAVRTGGDAGAVVALEGVEGTEARFKQEVSAASRVHLAAHGVLDDRQPAFSRLALAPGDGEDGWLHAYEVAALDLEGARAILSACETAGTPIEGEGLLGLARAFLVAGCRSTVATRWRVDDEATASLMEWYYQGLRAGAEPAHALRQAQVAVLTRERDGVRLVHPFFWAAFTHIGLP